MSPENGLAMRVFGMTSAELRVLGCLLEKQHTTPDAYPLSLNALRLACNQSTNRDPVTAYDEDTVREAASACLITAWRGWPVATAPAPSSTGTCAKRRSRSIAPSSRSWPFCSCAGRRHQV